MFFMLMHKDIFVVFFYNKPRVMCKSCWIFIFCLVCGIIYIIEWEIMLLSIDIWSCRNDDKRYIKIQKKKQIQSFKKYKIIENSIKKSFTTKIIFTCATLKKMENPLSDEPNSVKEVKWLLISDRWRAFIKCHESVDERWNIVFKVIMINGCHKKIIIGEEGN